jgi:hypothetical protein
MLRRLLSSSVVACLLVALALPADATHPVLIGCYGERTRVVYVAEADDGSSGVPLQALDSRCIVPLRISGVLGSTPALHPDGRHVAIDVRDPSGARVIRLLEDERHVNRILTQPPSAADGQPGRDTRPAWSPDGSVLLFTRTVGEVRGLFTVAAGGGAAEPVPGTTGALSGSWSPDGTRIAYSVAVEDVRNGFGTERGALVVSRLDGSERTELGIEGTDPAWSPDGSALAFSAITDEGSPPFIPASRKIALVAPTGGPVTLLGVTGRPGAAVRPAWLPDGQSLLYSQRRSGMDGRSEQGGLWTVDRSGLRSGPWQDGPYDEASPSVAGRAVRQAATGGAESTFTALPPRRVLDTRASGSPLRAGEPVDVRVTGQACSGRCAEVPADASAVALTVTALAGAAGTDVVVYPSDAALPAASNVNAAAGETVANAVVVPVGADGQVRLRSSGGLTHVLVDVAGYFRPGEGGAGFSASDPRRILDTRPGSNVGAPPGRIGAAGTLDLQVTGELPHADGGTVRVPDDATAVVLNLTATGATANTDVRAYPLSPAAVVPEVSSLNLRRGQTAASLVTVAVGDGGTVRLRNAGGEVHLIADLAGWFSPSAPGRFVAASPVRFLDTREGLGAAPLPAGAGELLDLGVAGARGVPPGASAVVLNLTGTHVTASTDVRVYPAGASGVPTVSNLNLVAGSTRANLAVVRPGPGGQVRLRSSAGQLAIIADVAGWFVAP